MQRGLGFQSKRGRGSSRGGEIRVIEQERQRRVSNVWTLELLKLLNLPTSPLSAQLAGPKSKKPKTQFGYSDSPNPD